MVVVRLMPAASRRRWENQRCVLRGVSVQQIPDVDQGFAAVQRSRIHALLETA
jgi:hypothetical protein